MDAPRGRIRISCVREHRHRLACGEIPQAYGDVHAAGNHLRVALLTLNICKCRSVPSDHMKLRFCAHVPNASRCIPASGDENVECWVQATESVHARNVSVTVPDDLVYFTICEKSY